MSDVQLVGKLLRLKNIISDEVYNAAMLKVSAPGNIKRIDQILIEDFHIDRDSVYTEIAKLYAIPKVSINVEEMTEDELDEVRELINSLPKDIKEDGYEKRIIPYKIQKKKNETLIILASSPIDNLAKHIASTLRFRRYEIYYCPFELIDKLIRHLTRSEQDEYLQKILDESDAQVEITSQEMTEEEQEDLIEQEINKGALVYLFEAALIEGVKSKVSDIHILPYDNNNVDIRFRVDGKLQLWRRKDNVNPQAFLAVVKDRTTNVDRFKIDEAQDGFIQREIENHIIRFRVSIMPVVSKEQNRNYESIVIRILDDRNVIDNIDLLGFLPQARKDFEDSVNKPQGLVIVTGPTGSGKSTTLLAALYHVITPEKNVLTVEDPVEYVIKGARQLKIGAKLDFAQAIRSILRHDPDIVMVGEMRD
ncbi:MAG: ATPase, T2SS/T4P/T4SS family, partial [Candidatus Cloacimonas sp.]|nr:Flp pilus assembly complex ATPase component TadA [Candidatus Cloacimonadota bacterium]